jgi:large subunit ribosomal protein L4
MEVDVLNMEGQKVRTVELPAQIFEAQVNVDLMHQAYVRQMANARLGTHNTKTRGEVSGGGRKPWKQRDRPGAQGSPAPQWVGGGRFTLHPRSYHADAAQGAPRCVVLGLTVKASEQRL